MSTEHRTHVRPMSSPRTFRAACSCGWESGNVSTRGQAQARANKHEREAVTSPVPVNVAQEVTDPELVAVYRVTVEAPASGRRWDWAVVEGVAALFDQLRWADATIVADWAPRIEMNASR